MLNAGVDTHKYRAHSIRAAATSKAFQAGGNIDDILRLAGWSNASTFARYYNKPIVGKSKVASILLGK